MTTANVVEGKPAEEDDSVKTTLIVVPSHLVKHWYIHLLPFQMKRITITNIPRRDQFHKHCQPEFIPETIIYRANSRLDTFNEIKALQNFEVM